MASLGYIQYNTHAFMLHMGIQIAIELRWNPLRLRAGFTNMD